MSRINKQKSNLSFLIMTLLASVLITGSVLYSKSTTNLQADATQIIPEANVIITDTNTTSSQISPDGLFSLTIKTQKNSKNEKTVEIFVQDEEQQQDTLIFTYQTDSSTSIEIPFNTWSPDNKYFFIQENTINNQRYLVFKTSGELIGETEFIDVASLYTQQEFSNSLTQITGWASNAYLVVLTTNGKTNASYWFDVYSHKFIRLSS